MRTYIPHNSKYRLEKHRYLELKAFARQYKSWQTAANDLYGLHAVSDGGVRNSEPSDPTERTAEALERYKTKMLMVEKAAKLASFYCWEYVLLNVTEGWSFDELTKRGKKPPCGINQFYEARQRFYWELDKIKG